MTEYTEYQQQQIAQYEYNDELEEGSSVNIDDGTTHVGTVDHVFNDGSGLDAYVVVSDDGKEVSVIYQGSQEVREDWMTADVIEGSFILTGEQGSSFQQKAASYLLNWVLKAYPDAQISVYGHSLGSMNAQYALANVSDTDRISGAYIYEGPNIYNTLNKKQQDTVDSMKYRIHNYVDQTDLVARGYNGNNSDEAVGTVYYVSPDGYHGLSSQHLWGGYEWDENGNLIIKDTSSNYEMVYAEGLDFAASGMYDNAQTKAYLLSDGSLSGHEQIYLDSDQALTISVSLKKITEIGTEQIKNDVDNVISEAKELYNNRENLARKMGVDKLSSDEITALYDYSGANYDHCVLNVEEEYGKKYDKAAAIKGKFSGLSAEIAQGIDSMLQADTTLAQEFTEWTNLI